MPGFDNSQRPPQGPRRTKSLPSKYMIPSEDIGQYEAGDPNRRRSAPPQAKPPGGGLFPLDEEGSYGAPPQQPGMPPSIPFRRIRERKPKLYSSYAVDANCEMHTKKLAETERKMSEERKYTAGSRPSSIAGSRPVSRAGSFSGRNSVSGSPAPSRRSFSGGRGGHDTVPRSRASSTGRSSRSPEPPQQNGGIVYSGGMPYTRKSSNGSMYPAAPKKTAQSWQNSLRDSSSERPNAPSNTSAKRKSRSSFSNQFRDLRESSFEENEEYEYAENQRSMSTVSRQQKSSTMSNGYSSSSSTNAYSSFTKSYQDGLGSGTTVSLTALRKPKIDSWDSMGILGLTTKIWNDTKKRQETFLESTGHFLREETSSYIM